MKILITGINFAPELTGIGKYSGEMAQWLAAKGHQVKIVTAPPYYPEWKVSKGYSAWQYSHELSEGVSVWRCPLWVPPKPSGLKRLLHLLSFALSSAPVMLAQIFWRPDVVIAIEPPLFCAPVAWVVAKLSGAKSWLHIQDFELDAAFNLGLLNGDMTKKSALYFECCLLSKFDTVSTISQKMLAQLAAKGVDVQHCVLLPNWVDLSSFNLEGKTVDFRTQLGIPSDVVVAMYSGNMGKKQGLEILGEVARICQSPARVEQGDAFPTPNIRFVFCGSGAGKEDLVLSCSHLDNVHFLDLQPLEHLPSLLQMADIHLLPQRAEVEDLVMPSKLTGILASGRPVVASARAGTELATVVEQCGVFVEPGDSNAFAAAVQNLAANALMRKNLGDAGKQFSEHHFDKEKILSDFEGRLLGL